MRDLGYSLEAALADLVDNSIAAHARNVWITFGWKGAESYVTILDDGDGMSETKLVEAMRPGSIGPLEKRQEDDLGRFGLGLKTASLSQCRLLTVSSSRGRARRTTRNWDLDYVDSTREWRLLRIPRTSTLPLLVALNRVSHGTIVIWENLDRLASGAREDDATARDHFLGKIQKVEDHLAMTFQRFLRGSGRLHLHVQGHQLEPWDPFLENEEATQKLSKEAHDLFGRSLEVCPWILPHVSKLSDPKLHDVAAGPKGWNAQQGFYIYRNRRLIVAGDWLGLGFKQEEHYKLARIQVDLPNTMDSEWQIDVRKASATPPPPLVAPLKRIARLTRNQAAEVYRNRGQVIRRQHAKEYQLVWHKLVKNEKVFYKLNREHLLIKEALAGATVTRDQLRAVLEVVENSLPVMAIIIDNVEKSDSVARPEDWESTELLRRRGLHLLEAFIDSGIKPDQALRELALVEPFDRFPDLLALAERRAKEVSDG